MLCLHLRWSKNRRRPFLACVPASIFPSHLFFSFHALHNSLSADPGPGLHIDMPLPVMPEASSPTFVETAPFSVSLFCTYHHLLCYIFYLFSCFIISLPQALFVCLLCFKEVNHPSSFCLLSFISDSIFLISLNTE